MRNVALILLCSAYTAGSAGAQTVPREIGNRAGGFSYQPTQQEVRPREAALGIRPSAKQQAADGQALERIDRDLLRAEGVLATAPRLASPP